MDYFLELHLELRGGIEQLFGNVKELTVSLENDRQWTMRDFLPWIKENHVYKTPELFLKGNTVRPGILVFVNDTDWELLGELDYELQNHDRIVFVSTLHGG